MSNPWQRLRLAVIGCGAVVEIIHLPTLARLGWLPSVLVDADPARARRLADRFGVHEVADDYRAVVGSVDAALVALPHHLHAPVAGGLLDRGIHTFVEKPLATRAEECRRLVARAEDRGVVLAIGLVRRFFPSLRWAKAALDRSLIGDIVSFDLREGFVYDWPVRSDFMFRRETAGGGVLMDTGSHALDLLIWWLGDDDVVAVDYRDDSFGGVEADCELRLTMASGVHGVIEFSRTRWLRNTAVITGTRGELEVGLREPLLRGRPASLLRRRYAGVRGRRLPQPAFLDPFAEQFADWATAIVEGRRPAVPAEDAARVVAMIERCYRERRRLSPPWETVEDLTPTSAPASTLAPEPA